MVLSSRLNITPEEANERFDLVMKESSILMLPLTDAIAVAAVSAFQVYGKGRNSKAKLNLADCFSYAFAKSNGFRLLYVGDDLSQTDIRPA